MSQTSTDRFLTRAAQIPLLTSAEEIHLGRLVQAAIRIKAELGDRKPTAAERRALRAGKRAKDRMVMANIRLAVKFARPMLSRCTSMTIDDLVQEAIHGVIEAVNKYDPERGYKFSTYASWWIRQRLNRGYSAKDATIKMAVHSLDMLYRLKKHAEAFAKAHGGQYPSIEILAELEGAPVDRIRPVLEAPQCRISLDQNGKSDDSALSLIDTISDDRHSEEWDAIQQEHIVKIVRDCLRQLPKDERNYLELRYGINRAKPLQDKEICERSPKTRWQVDADRKAAIRKLWTDPVMHELALSC